ncbi:MAG: 50S ribosomal protein L25 [Pseudomonadota bacterium]
MAELLKLNVQERTKTGKGHNRRLRLKEMVPGIYYDQKGTNIPVQVKLVPLQKAYAKLGKAQVFELVLEREGKTETMPALLWRVRNEPVSGLPEHVDFFGIDLTKDIKVAVHYEIKGSSKGVKLGGRLDLFRDTIEVICKPMTIPESIVIDITELDMLDSIHIADIAFPEGVTPLYDENYAVLTIAGKLTDEEEGEGKDDE